ncbi:uncharacterized protein LOC127705810 isoform X2 [Mytilus californianus]|uniref:uncharacterized protein LOC127705810 isoform X2 n=1 Tax=Mytilus californianus TaxID=6549 RepID=UPI0022470B86|nr:uncharacterized protein LOC127705810 isoform X2 [Mytilus californianus]
MNRILQILTFYLLADAVFSAIPCLTWEMTLGKLDIICRLDNVVLPVSIYDTFEQEQGKCAFKDFSAICSSVNNLTNITASYSKREFKLSITNVTRSLAKGEWSCIQGTHTFKTLISPLAGIISSTEVVLTGNISRHQSSMKTVNLSCFSCREPHGNHVEFLINHHSVDNVRYDHVTKRCLHKDGECRPDHCSCSNSGNLFYYTFEFTDKTTEISFTCGMRFVDKLLTTRFSKFSSVIYNGKEFKSNGSETEITKDPVNNGFNHSGSDNKTDNRPNSPVKEDADFIKTGLKWAFVGVAVVLPVLLTVVIVCCRLHITRKRKELLLRKRSGETAELNPLTQPLLTGNKDTEPKEHKDNVGKLVLLIANIAKKVIKKIITCTLLTNDQTLTSYLKNVNNKHALFHAWHNNKRCCQCKTDDNVQKESMLTKQQFHIMFNNSGSVPQSHQHIKYSKIYCFYNIEVNENVSLDVLDVSVATCLLVCGCTPEIVPELTDRQSILDSMKNIKDKRNEIFHMTALKHLSDDEFTDKWQKIRIPVVKLASVINSHFHNEIKGEINVLKNENLEDTTAYSEKLTGLLMQSKQDMDLKINQLCEERFMAKLGEANKGIERIRKRERTVFTKFGDISINIVQYPDVKVEDYPDRNTLDVLLRVQAPNEWNDDEIMEMIRQMVDQINSRGNIKIKETTLENFMLIVEMKIEILIEEEPLKSEIEYFFRIICQLCNIDITQPNTIEVSIENLSHTNSYSLDERPSEVELVFIRSFVVQKGKDAFFTSCAVWSDNHYILIDRNNALLLMYNHNTGDIQSEDLRNEPFSMAIIENNNVAISFPERQEIAIYSLSTSNKFKFKEVIKVDGKCFTLTKKDDETLLVYIDGKGIHSFNMSKKEFKSLDIQIPSFVPHSDEICARNNRLYHTSRSSSSVFCYDMNGSKLWNFKGVLKRPTALTCDKFGNVYVTDYTSHHLYFISADGQSCKTLLGRKDQLWYPTFVYYCMKRNCLLIVNRDNGDAASYSIKYKY